MLIGAPSPTVPDHGTASALLATVSDATIRLVSRDGEVSVSLPLDVAPTTTGGGVPAMSVVCALDTALARRFYRRVSAWALDGSGTLSARVRPSS